MPETSGSTDPRTKPPEQHFTVAAPQLSLPKGGGAIRGIGEKFTANPVTGTGSMSVPIYISPGRSGFGPQLALAYDSGAGNSAFGFGWTLSLPSITRKTDKGLPQYVDTEESDVFILSGAEDLMPVLVESNGAWARQSPTPTRMLYGQQYAVETYRPRVEGLFARIERWANVADPSDAFWRSISKDNITTWYGRSSGSRVFDPADPTRIFIWLICESSDDKGNVISYQYKPEDSTGVDATAAPESNRTGDTRSAQRYLQYVFYGNRTPYFPNLIVEAPVALPTDWCFKLVLDYGDHDLANPQPVEPGLSWTCRADAYSTYRPTFEVRTYRLCRRVLMFHNFPQAANVGADCLVRSTDFTHAQFAQPPADPTAPFYSLLLAAAQTGYVRQAAGGYLSKSLPPLEFQYTAAVIDETVRDVDAASLQNLPSGLDSQNYRWVDLDGEGLSGILTEQGNAWFYKPNLSAANQQAENGVPITLPQFGPVQVVERKPTLAALGNGRQQLMDLSGDGRIDLVDFNPPTPGFYARTPDADWEPFAPFPSNPVIDWRNPNLKFIDLTGDGFADLLISEDNAFWWHNSLSTDGFGPAQRVAQSLDEEAGPQLVFADSTETIFLADMSGDGLTDLVRIRLGEVCYWPNLGYGRFGAKVTMDGSPWFDRPELFDPRRIRLADIDGSGTADIIYFTRNRVDLYFSQSGNAYGQKRTLSHFPAIDNLSTATALDLLGNGTSCLAWSSPLASNAGQPMRYIDLMGGQKPHLLVNATNNLGGETRIHYAPSTKFYVADKMAGAPWLTRLPFPVQVVEQIETYDYISRNHFVTQYAYHHGYYDGVEREFRGFARVDQWDSEQYATLTTSSAFPAGSNINPASNVPPVLTKTWYHTGAFFGENRISKFLAHEYYQEGDANQAIAGLSEAQQQAMLLPDTLLPTQILLADGTRIDYDLSGEEMREACRSLRGSVLRQEVYALDGTAQADRPYSASERNYTIEMFQPQGPNEFGVFLSHAREAIDYHYERQLFKVVGNTLADPSAPPANAINAADPRVTHSMTLAVDAYGNVLQSLSIGYGRRYLDPTLQPADQARQSVVLSTYAENTFTKAVIAADAYRAPLAAQASVYELLQFQPDSALAGITNLFGFGEVGLKLATATDGNHDVLFENVNPGNLVAGQPYRRLIQCLRTLYRPDDVGAAANDPNALLPLGTMESLALAGCAYKMAFTPGLITQVFERSSTALMPTPASVMASVAADGGGYVDLDGDGHWWIPSGRTYFIGAPSTPQQEQAEAAQAFYATQRFEDPFGNAASVVYDLPNFLYVLSSLDPAGNTASVAYDYRALQAQLFTDSNGNQSACAFDAMGMVVGMAVMGKTSEHLGDSLTGFTADLTQQQIDDYYNAADPHTLAPALLGTATSRYIYDLNVFQTSRAAAPTDPTGWQPVFASTIARETHVSDLAPNQQSNLQITFVYSDGFSREILRKGQAEPGPVVDGGPTVNPRWVASGWTIFNNKAKPVRQYEPFFSQLSTKGHQFEFGMQVGVSAIVFYDPIGRVVATLHPNHTYDKVLFDVWRQDTWDVTDTVLQADPTADLDVGDYFQLLPAADYSPTWYTQRASGGLGPQEQDAANKAAAQAKTPATAYLDSLGRSFLTVADNGAAGKYLTHVGLDIQNNQRTITDALNRTVMNYDYDMLGTHIHQSNVDAGERWILNNAAGKSIRAWDNRGHNFRTTYDGLQRATGQFVLGTDAANSDPRTLAGEIQFETTVYGEGQANNQTLNLRTRIFQHCDQAGVVTNLAHNNSTNRDQGFDFKGNLLASRRQLLSDYKNLTNWLTATPTFELDVTSATRYDALNRSIAITTPDGSITVPTYNEANLLATVSVNLQGAATSTPFLSNVLYDAKGLRVLCDYANGVSTSFTYDPLTFRMTRVQTTRASDNALLQDLTLTYDPVGNVTQVADAAQPAVFFNNAVVTATALYQYDALYRVVQASGREHAAQAAAPEYDWNDAPRVGLPQPGDGTAMRAYTEQFQYDMVGNIQSLVHQATNGSWTRLYAYDPLSNRLLSSSMPGDSSTAPYSARYTYDGHGNMAQMPHLPLMRWDFADRLLASSQQAVNAGTPEITYYVYDAAGQRVRKITEGQAAAGQTPTRTTDRIYLGDYEVYREFDGTGTNVTLERQTLHVNEGKQCLALVETNTLNTASPVAAPAPAIRYQFTNHLGSATLELDNAGMIITYEEYYIYGATSYQPGRSSVEASLKRYRFIGKERDEETGLYYVGARYYAPWLGRWTATDPAGLAGGTNMYRYASCNPATKLDTDGKTDWFFRDLTHEFFPPTALTSLWLAINAQPGPTGPKASPTPEPWTKDPRSAKEIKAKPGAKSAEEITEQRKHDDLKKQLASSQAVDPFSVTAEVVLKAGALTEEKLAEPRFGPVTDPSSPGPAKLSTDRNPDSDVGGFAGKLIPKLDQKSAPVVAYVVPATLAAGILKPQGLPAIFKTVSIRKDALEIGVDSYPVAAPVQNNYFGGIFKIGITAAVVGPKNELTFSPDSNGVNAKEPTYKKATEHAFAEQAKRFGYKFNNSGLFYDAPGPLKYPRELASFTGSVVVGGAGPVGSGPITLPTPGGPLDATGSPQATLSQVTMLKPTVFVGLWLKLAL
jgi:RHS repeat-associated protein